MTTPNDSTTEQLLKDIYGKDVVDNAYASPAGRLTKAQARTAILNLIAEAEERAELRGRLKELESELTVNLDTARNKDYKDGFFAGLDAVAEAETAKVKKLRTTLHSSSAGKEEL